jgi:hypothetical protein
MLTPFFSTMMLATESQRVIELRLVRIALGGAEAQAEMQSMVSEKIGASIEAAGTLVTGGSFEIVVSRYREHVAFNTERLTAA